MDSDMAVLVPVAARVFDGCETQTVDARDLHAVLQLSSAFTDWLAYQIQSLELIENTDFFNFSEVSEKPGRPRLEYLLTLDCAKHIAMASRSERGRMVRQYFIEVEKRMRAMAKPLQAQMSANLPTDYLSALEALVEAEKAKRAQALEMEAQRKLLAEAQPNVEFFLAGKRKGHPVTDALCFLKGLSYNQRQWRCWRIASCLTPNSEKENLRCLTILSLPVQIPQVN